MALATQCPHCGTMFRVASDQLKLRGGIVRCGACQEIFDGSASLVDLDQPQARVPAPPAAPSSSEQPTSAPSTVAAADLLPFTLIEVGEVDEAGRVDEPDTDDTGELPVYTLDFGRTFEPFGILPKVTPPVADTRAAQPEAAAPEIDAAQAGPDPVAAGEELAELAQPEVAEAPQEPVQSEPEEEAPASAIAAEAVAEPSLEPAVAAAAEAGAADLAAPATTESLATEPAAAEPSVAESSATESSAAESSTTESLAAEPVATERAETEPVAEPVIVSAPESVPAVAADAAADTVQVPRADDRRDALVPAGDGRREPGFGPPDEELVARPLPDQAPTHATHADDTALLLMRESAVGATPAVPGAVPARSAAARRAEKAAARRSKLVPTKIEPQPKLRTPDIDEPEFVRRGRQQEQSGRTRKLAMLGGSLVLLLLMLAQGAYLFRNALAARIPSAKPALVAGCAVLGCRVELPAQVDNLAIETGELTTLGGGAYSFTTELRNSGDTAQAWPSLELALTDADDKPLVRRVFAPRDYLGPNTPLANGIAPRTEQAITLHFRVNDLKPSGYHIAVFYP